MLYIGDLPILKFGHMYEREKARKLFKAVNMTLRD